MPGTTGIDLDTMLVVPPVGVPPLPGGYCAHNMMFSLQSNNTESQGDPPPLPLSEFDGNN